ncbi:MAG: hypothetical protein JW717_12225 [Marinilabiliaceae bacterium]|nr:hypothetical protein [Marinilabiliaceae bacterium]
MQYAGNIGFLSLGAGYQIKQRYEPTLLLGYLSQTFGNSSTDVITVSLKNSFRLNTKPLFECVTLKSGVSINWGYTNNTFSSLPEHYPDKYYFQNKIHLAPFWGAEVTIIVKSKSLKVVGFYFEFATLDAYLLECIRTDYVKLNDIWNLALGMTLYIH